MTRRLMVRVRLLALALILPVLPFGAHADVVVLVHGYLSGAPSWDASGVVPVLESRGWRRAGVLPAGPTNGTTALGATTVTIASLTVALGALAWLAESRADDLLQNLQHQKQRFLPDEPQISDDLLPLSVRLCHAEPQIA